jgi:ubiquinone/menaquinone biosynthesis C-methylase UbiE
LHCLDDVKTVLKELKRVLTADGTAALTTLVRNKRWSDSYLNLLARSGVVVPRSPDHLLSAFDDLDMPVKHQINGNLAFINYG